MINQTNLIRPVMSTGMLKHISKLLAMFIDDASNYSCLQGLSWQGLPIVLRWIYH